MDEPLPPDPYVTLSVPSNADENAIKSAYKKLALKCHPDKFLDEEVKKVKADEFHKLNQAYELLTDPEKKKRWELDVKLADMKKEAMERAAREGRGPPRRSQSDIPTHAFKTRTAAPSFATAEPTPQEKRQKSYDDYDYGENRTSSRKPSAYDAPSYKPTRASREATKESVKSSTERKRAEEKRAREKAEARDRDRKYERSSSEEDYKTRRADERRRYEEEVKVESSRRKADDGRKEDKYSKKYEETFATARDYITGGRENDRPSTSRKDSAAKMEYIRAVDGRATAAVRRSSAKPKDRSHSRRDIVDYPEERERRPPSMSHATSSPPALNKHQDSAQRGYGYPRTRSPAEVSPKPGMRRAETMPSNTSRRRDGPSSKLREEDSGYSSPESPESHFPGKPGRSYTQPNIATAAPMSSTKHRYPAASMPVVPEAYDIERPSRNEPPIVERKPGGSGVRHHRSPSPMSPLVRDPGPKSSSRSSYPSPQQYATAVPKRVYAYDMKPMRPGMAPQSASTQSVPRQDDRGRQQSRDSPYLFGEVEPGYTTRAPRPAPDRKSSYRPDEVQYTKKYDAEDVQYSKRDPAVEAAFRMGQEDGMRRASASQRTPRDRGYDRRDNPLPMPGLTRASSYAIT